MRTERIANARIMTSRGVVEGDVAFEVPGVSGRVGHILEVGNITSPADVTYDAHGAWVVPGGVDAHVHFGGFGDIPIADGFYRGSRAALAGGTTTVIDFVEPDGDESVEHAIARRLADASTSAADYLFRLVLTEAYRSQLKDLALAERAGIHDFKLFTIYDGETLREDDLSYILETLSDDPRRTFLVHAEDPDEIEKLRAEHGDSKNFLDLAKTRPPQCEERMTRMLWRLVEETGARLCIAHATTAGTMGLLDGPAPARGEFTVETCPHYLEFSEESLGGANGCLYTMTPPLRDASHIASLWDKMLSGRLILSTDHCPYSFRYKRGTTYQTVPCGVDGVWTRMSWLYSEGVMKGGMGMRQFVRLTSENAAKFYGLYPHKGAIEPGSDADLVVIRDVPWQVHVEDAPDALDYTIWEGKRLNGSIARTYRGGVLAFDGVRVLARPSSGRQIDKTRMEA